VPEIFTNVEASKVVKEVSYPPLPSSLTI
jgi:hypothetical protein